MVALSVKKPERSWAYTLYKMLMISQEEANHVPSK